MSGIASGRHFDPLKINTHWWGVLLLFFAGCTTALHIGKVPSALPIIRVDFGLSLTQAGLILSMYAVLIATSGLLLGLLTRRFSLQVFAITGVGAVGVGSLLGAQSDAFIWLLVTRAVEGLGWIMTAISMPSILSALSHPRDRSLVMGIWGAFVPVGAGVMLLLSPMLLSQGGWRLSWWVAGVLSLLASVVVVVIVRAHAERLVQPPASQSQGVNLFADLRRPLIWVLSGSFLLYTLQFLSVTAFLPTLLLETTSLSLSDASQITALVIVSNALGNVAAGYLLKRGMSHIPLLVTGALGMGIMAVFVFFDTVPIELRVACAFGVSILGGLIPGTCFATLPKAVSVVAASGLMIGLMMQCAGFGQLLGGVVVPFAVDVADTWHAAGWVSLAIGVAGTLLALFSRREP